MQDKRRKPNDLKISDAEGTARMRHKIDTPEARKIYAKRSSIVEPVFGNIRFNKRLDHFTYRGQKKVSVQWRLYCLVHNMEDLTARAVGIDCRRQPEGRDERERASQKIAHFGKKYGPKAPPPPVSDLLNTLTSLITSLHHLTNAFWKQNLRSKLTFLTCFQPHPCTL